MKIKTPKWFDLIHLRILSKVNKGIGLTEIDVRNGELTRAFQKLHSKGFIEGTYFIGFKTHKEGSQLTEKGKALLEKFNKRRI